MVQKRNTQNTTARRKKGARAQTPDEQDSYFKNLLFHEDTNEAIERARKKATLDYDSENISEIETLRSEIKEKSSRLKKYQKLEATLYTKLISTDQEVRLPPGQGKKLKDEEELRMSGKDKITVALTTIAAILTLFMGASNIYSNLMASGTIVFLEKQYLAIFISALLPTGSIALKYASNFMRLDSSRRRYAQCVYTCTILSLLAWTILFSMNFSGVSGGLDIDALLDDSGSENLLVWIQIMAELLVGSALFLVIEDIMLKYNPEVVDVNPKYTQLQKKYASLKQENIDLEDLCAKKTGRLREVEKNRERYIEERVERFRNLVSHFQK